MNLIIKSYLIAVSLVLTVGFFQQSIDITQFIYGYMLGGFVTGLLSHIAIMRIAREIKKVLALNYDEKDQ